MYDEKTGKPRQGRAGLLERTTPTPCEADSCHKGHWKNPIQIRAKDMKILKLHKISRATSGAGLNAAELSDSVCMHALSRINEVTEAIDNARTSGAIAAAVLSAARFK